MNDLEYKQYPELNSGFIAGNSSVGATPVFFSEEVSKEGVYRVSVTIYTAKDVSGGLVFTGCRRLALKKDFKAGETYTGSFLTHVCPIIPRGCDRVTERRTLDVTAVGEGLEIKSVSAKLLPDAGIIYIAGDSTVTDQSAEYPYHPSRSYSGWGQMLSCFVGSRTAVSNHAHSGLTTVSMRSEGHFGIIEERIKKGDICLFQFGHNDQKLSELKAREGYRAKLEEYVDEMLERGVTPVIVSPLARNTWKAVECIGEKHQAGPELVYNDLLEEYAFVCGQLAQEKHIPYIDLHGYAMSLIQTMGRDAVKCYFYPSDYTHTNDYGAYRFAGFVYSEMVRLGLVPFTGFVSEWRPETEPDMTAQLPDGGRNKPAGQTNAVMAIDRPDDYLTRAEAFRLAVTAMKFFPTNVYNDMFDDVVGHETYAGSIQCAYQNGFIPDGMVRDRKIEPERNITSGEFFEILRLAYSCRMADAAAIDALTARAPKPDELIRRGCAADICSNISI